MRILWLTLALTLSGCGGAPQIARTAVFVSASGIAEAHRLATVRVNELADLPQEEAAQHLGAAITLQQTLAVADSALQAAEAALDIWEHVGGEAWLEAARCLADLLADVMTALQALGVEVPDTLTSGTSILTGIFGPCESTAGAVSVAPVQGAHAAYVPETHPHRALVVHGAAPGVGLLRAWGGGLVPEPHELPGTDAHRLPPLGISGPGQAHRPANGLAIRCLQVLAPARVASAPIAGAT